MLTAVKLFAFLVSIVYFCEKRTTMQIISAREFRSNQGKYLGAAINGQTILLKSKYGHFRITPVSEEESLTTRICRGLNEVKQIREGKIKGYSVDELLHKL
jgi:hypothetical protein